ncbi:hypothetical protein [Microbacterium thalli]|uniref:Uncharacterized protein n=1 Tax=Microbacterium thalli TaxID=3027921 RepID=A0ABT5SLZ0_9MICO|nr:hypothetical protein [Microbacterium thalli]MDD7963151.1 hypothetical protein [Microbacterium thalli]
MSIHEKVSRRVRRWDADVVVDPAITRAQWRAVRRRVRGPVAVGLGLSAVLGLGVLLIAFGWGWEERTMRVVTFGGVVTVALILAFVTVAVTRARSTLPQRHPALFTSRRATSGSGGDSG